MKFLERSVETADMPALDDDVPAYLRDTYAWCYLDPRLARLLDRQWVVEAILWGNGHRLADATIAEMRPGWRVLQPAAVYGDFSRRLATALGPEGRLEVRDVSALQVARTRVKLADCANATVERRDAAAPGPATFDGIACFFLLHEVPDPTKIRIVRAMLGRVRPGGRVVFTDYHRPHRLNPLRPLMAAVFERLEPFARTLWTVDIAELAGAAGADFDWRTTTSCGGLHQVTVATRRGSVA